MKPAALVTLAIGQQHLDYWQSFCQASWKVYAQAHGYDLFVFSEPLDSSPLAAPRPPPGTNAFPSAKVGASITVRRIGCANQLDEVS